MHLRAALPVFTDRCRGHRPAARSSWTRYVVMARSSWTRWHRQPPLPVAPTASLAVAKTPCGSRRTGPFFLIASTHGHTYLLPRTANRTRRLHLGMCHRPLHRHAHRPLRWPVALPTALPGWPTVFTPTVAMTVATATALPIARRRATDRRNILVMAYKL